MMTGRYREHWRRPSTDQTWRKKNPKLSQNLLNFSQMKMLRRNKPGVMYRSILGDSARGFEDFGDLNSDIQNVRRVSGSGGWPNEQRISRNRPKVQRRPDHRSNFLRQIDNRLNMLKRPDHGSNMLTTSYHGPNMLSRTAHGSNMLRRSDYGSSFLRMSNELKRSGHNPNVQWRSTNAHPTDITWPEKGEGLPVRNRPEVWTDDYWVDQQLYQPYTPAIG